MNRLVLFVLAIFSLHVQTLVFDHEELDRVASEYGYKYANLRELEKVSREFNQKNQNLPYKIAVPVFAGVNSRRMLDFLASIDFPIRTKWNELLKRHFPTEESQLITIRGRKFPPAFLEGSRLLEKEIIDVFEKYNTELGDKKIDFGHVFGEARINKVMSDVAKFDERLMLRSSGREDSINLANAGGNESVSNVEPTAIEMLRATSAVVASYFANKSLIQRLEAGDKTIFDDVPFAPMVIQRMIGEKPGRITKCGVMFTEEAEGASSRLHAGLRSGITAIDAAFGHNEAVVNSRIPVDSFYIDREREIYPIIRNKTHRHIPSLTEKRKLDLVKNDPAIAKIPALNRDALLTLKAFAEELEQYYGYATDVEFVVDEENKIIYTVQARPIVHKADLPPPSYLLNVDDLAHKMHVTGVPVGVAGGSLRIGGRSNVIVAATINDALKANQDEARTDQVVAVVVGGRASPPATSHEATVFRNEGKPVIYVEKYQIVEQWLKQKEMQLLISPQQGVVAPWQTSSITIPSLVADKSAAMGWINYPVAPHVSLIEELTPTERITDDAVKEFLPDDVDKNEFLLGLKEQGTAAFDKEIANRFASLLKLLKLGSEREARLALAQFLYQLPVAINKAAAGLSLEGYHNKTIDLIERQALSFAKRIRDNLSYDSHDAGYTNRLLPIRFLESLLTQPPRFDKVVESYSVSTLIEEKLKGDKENIRELEAIGEKVSPQMLPYLRIATLALPPSLENDWRSFIIALDKYGDESATRALRNLLMTLGKIDMLSVWLHTSFAQAYRHMKDRPAVLVSVLINEYESQKEFLNKLLEKSAEIDAINVESFDDPKNFDANWQIVYEQIWKYFYINTFIRTYGAANKFAQFAALAVMKKFVDVLDRSIKAVSGSRRYEIALKLIRFRDMVRENLDMLRSWIRLVPPSALAYSKGAFGIEITFKDYDRAFTRVVEKSDLTESDLRMSTDFNAIAFTIGSGMDIVQSTKAMRKDDGPGIKEPESMEEVFTSIHQSLLVLLGALSVQAGAGEIPIPESLAKVRDALLGLRDNVNHDARPVLIGADIRKFEISFLYNMPLRGHSIQFELTYNKISKSCMLTAKFVGENFNNRWSKINHYMSFLNEAEILRVGQIMQHRDGIELSFSIDDKTNVNEVIAELKNALDSTYIFGGPDFDAYEMQKKLKSKDVVKILESLEEKFGFKQLILSDVNRIVSDYKSTWIYKLLELLIRDYVALDWAARVADEYLMHEDAGLKGYGRRLFVALVNKKAKMPEALKSATHLFSSSSPDYYFANEIFSALSKQGFDASPLVHELMQGSEEYKIRAFILIERLVVDKQNINDISKLLDQVFESTATDRIYLYGLNAARALVGKNKEINKAVAMVKHVIGQTRESQVLEIASSILIRLRDKYDLKTLVDMARLIVTRNPMLKDRFDFYFNL